MVCFGSKVLMWNGGPFSGTKIALICEAALVACLRDSKEGIAFPGMWKKSSV